MPDRLLPKEDHGNLYMAATAGIFAETMELGARGIGIDLRVDPASGIDPAKLSAHSEPVVVGTARIVRTHGAEPEWPALIQKRQTSRLPYDGRAVGTDVIAELERVARVGGHDFISVDPSQAGSQERVDHVLHQNALAILANLLIREERKEIQRWYRYGKTPEFGDGLWREPMVQPTWEMKAGFAVPHAFTIPGLKDFAIHRYLQTMTGTQHVGLLNGKYRSYDELFAAGRLMMKFWLEMTRHGVVMHPFGSMLTNGKYAHWVADEFGVGDCYLIFRYGFSDKPPRAPRLQSVLSDESGWDGP